MIEIDNITRTYGAGETATAVLQGISFAVEQGEYLAIMGSSGTGKTTLMNILGLLDRPSSGGYQLDGTDVTTLDDDRLSDLRNRKLGFVFQQFHLLERIGARQNVLLPLLYAEAYPTDAEERAHRALESVGLGDRLDHRPNELSGGQQQRVAIARALINRPGVILADEPTGNLDRRSSLEVLGIFARLHAEGTTIILVTHDEEVAEHARRVLRMADGKIVEDRPVAAPRDPTAELAELDRQAAEGES
jgi:putative ABC transport system ATP-binding protein